MSGENGKQFKGTINLDIRDSKPDWDAFLYKKAPKDAPNVLVILYDDTGCAAWSPYGGRINMPTMDRLAANGLTYSQWHTTAVCSPTRSCFLTGRNHHANGFGSISEMAVLPAAAAIRGGTRPSTCRHSSSTPSTNTRAGPSSGGCRRTGTPPSAACPRGRRRPGGMRAGWSSRRRSPGWSPCRSPE